jgi:restriction system protein
MALAATTIETPAMKFKMAPNSLFAILLRSPWWISLLIAAVFAGASRAFLPDAYWVFGAMGGFPFLGIGVYAFLQQMQAPSAQQSEAILKAVSTMGWREFADALEQGFTAQRYKVQRIDGAADFLLQREGRTTIVAARRWKAAHVGAEALESLQAAAPAYGASQCQYVTLGQLSDNALGFAKKHGVQLVQADALTLLLRGMTKPGK